MLGTVAPGTQETQAAGRVESQGLWNKLCIFLALITVVI